MIRSLFLSFAMVALLSGCGSDGVLYRDAKPGYAAIAQGQARLYIYRETSVFGTRVQPQILLDGAVIRTSVPGSYTKLDINPGSHVLSVANQTQKTYSFKADPKAELFVREAPGGGWLVGNVAFQPVAPLDAAKEMASLHEQALTAKE